MKRATGIGGVFFKSNDPKKLQAWYEKHLGLPVDDHGGIMFVAETGPTVWSAFKKDTTYFGTGPQSSMINYRVDDLHALIAALRAEGVTVDDKVEEHDYGKFGWATDPEGNRFEMWEPPKGKPAF
jgi:predicted enzyme related to lactoylglutathione lyase